MEIRFIDIITWLALCFLLVLIVCSCIRERIVFTGDPEAISIIMECKALKKDFNMINEDFIDCQQSLEMSLDYIGEFRHCP